MTAAVKVGGVFDQPVEPSQFVVKFGTRLWVAVWKIQAADDHAVHCSFEIAAVGVAFAAGKSTPAFQRVHPFGEDGHAVPRCLPMPDSSVTSCANVIDRESHVGGL